MIKYTPHTHIAVSIAERKDQIKSLYTNLSNLYESIQELLPAGELMQRYSHCKTKQDRMKDQINYLKRALDDLQNPDSSFTDEANDSLISNIQTQISLCDSDVSKLLDKITQAELDNVLHTINLKLSTIEIPLESDLNQEAASDILFSYIERLRNINISFEKQYCLSNELDCYRKLLSDEEESYDKFKLETNEMIQKLEQLIEEKKNESEKQSQKYEKLKINEKKLVEDFQGRMDLLKEASDYLIEKSSQADENYDSSLVNAINELFLNLQDPNATDGDIRLVLESIIHLANLKSTQPALDDFENDQKISLFSVNSNDNNNNNDSNNFNFDTNLEKPNKFEGFSSFINNSKINKNNEFPSSTNNKANQGNGFTAFINNPDFGLRSFPNNNFNTNNSSTMNSNDKIRTNNAYPTFKYSTNNNNNQNPLTTPNNQSYHQIIASLQQKVSMNSPK